MNLARTRVLILTKEKYLYLYLYLILKYLNRVCACTRIYARAGACVTRENKIRATFVIRVYKGRGEGCHFVSHCEMYNG